MKRIRLNIPRCYRSVGLLGSLLIGCQPTPDSSVVVDRSEMEVMNVSIFEYDAEKHLIMEKEESRAEGRAEGSQLCLLQLIIENRSELSVETSAKILKCDKNLVNAVYRILDDELGMISVEDVYEKLIKEGVL